MVQEAGLTVALITGRHSGALAHRALNLRISHVIQGVRDKLAVLRSLQHELGVTPEETAVMGDDLVDLPMMEPAGLAVAVADAPAEVQGRAHLVTAAPGGRGAVREVCELLLKAQGRWEEMPCGLDLDHLLPRCRERDRIRMGKRALKAAGGQSRRRSPPPG
jgi:3-deoxy-D-manno-octulosonate 8-phosphate phosphatase (KDO 8-P phosphatase)